jgi:hypothetical protein
MPYKEMKCTVCGKIYDLITSDESEIMEDGHCENCQGTVTVTDKSETSTSRRGKK